MTEQEIKQNNALIAIFMGKTVYPEKGTPEHKKWKGQARDYEVFQLKYHESWDWLKPVIDKIYSYALAHPSQLEMLRKMSIVVILPSAYDACIKFIKWYNDLCAPKK